MLNNLTILDNLILLYHYLPGQLTYYVGRLEYNSDPGRYVTLAQMLAWDSSALFNMRLPLC